MNSLPIFTMVGLIPFFGSDLALLAAYAVVILAALLISYERGDATILLFGLVVMTLFELLFIATGVEVFERRSLLGVMPIWLPLLWGYGFVAISRGALLLRQK